MHVLYTHYTFRVFCAKSIMSNIDSPLLKGVIAIGLPHSHNMLYIPPIKSHVCNIVTYKRNL